MTEQFMLHALAVTMSLALIAAPLGCFVIWQRKTDLAATLSHAGIIGVIAAIALALHPLLGVLSAALAVGLLLGFLGLQSRVPIDGVLAVLTSSLLAIGVVATMQVDTARNELLVALLFGDVFSINSRDLYWVLAVGVGALTILARIWRPLLSSIVDRDLAAAEGVQVDRIWLIFVLLLAVVVAMALKFVGALITVAFLTMPGAAARPFAETPEQMAFFATILALLSVALGLFLAFSAELPGGPVVVLVLTVIYATSVIVAVGRGDQ